MLKSLESVSNKTKFVFHIMFMGALLLFNGTFISQFFEAYERPTDESSMIVETTNIDHNYDFDASQVVMQTSIPENSFLSTLLTGQGVPYNKVYQLVESVKDQFDVRQIRAGKKCAFVTHDICTAPSHFVYEPNKLEYFVFDLDQSTVKKVKRKVDVEIKTAAGTVDGSLWLTMDRHGYRWSLIDRMEEALAWSLDFYSIQNGDEFKLIYEELSVDGQVVGVGSLLGAYYKNYGNEYYAIHYENEKYSGFYDIEGRPNKRTFLKAPVKFSRVSSGYTPRRFHPVLKRFKAHLGTDYAAPRGTPIFAVANGVVTKASFTRGNGNYVKIKHDKTYQTQYLHMLRFATGIRPGVHVKQGQVIGYVGKTGLATGYHVCFRFWKNGRQVNHRRLNFPPADPLPQHELKMYECQRDFVVDLLDQIEIPPAPPQLVKNDA